MPHTMRVISGTFRGRRIQGAKGSWLRPTTDRVRTYIFDKLGGVIHDADVLDLYAGSGALGIEAMSRGAKSVLFVDSSPAAAEIIAQNLNALGTPSTAVVVRAEVLHYFQKLAGTQRTFDIIFADPPYEYREHRRLIEEIVSRAVLRGGGTLVLEQRYSVGAQAAQGPLKVVAEKKFGNTSILWFKNCGGPR